ncbi:hypothetical protein F5I97DRAFT_1906371 [Phlebopus sp. FC_14]|nr:hypothetical protein F5I97DRAFT_1906371 [Phlebopus sp. FC_14]
MSYYFLSPPASPSHRNMSHSRSPLPETETFRLGPLVAPRIWVGLWQLSSPAWGSASAAKVREAMTRHVELGYTAFDMVRGRSSTLFFPIKLFLISRPYGRFITCSQGKPETFPSSLFIEHYR